MNIFHCYKRSKDILGGTIVPPAAVSVQKDRATIGPFAPPSLSLRAPPTHLQKVLLSPLLAVDLEQPGGTLGGEIHPSLWASYRVLLKELLPASRNWAASSFSASEGF